MYNSKFILRNAEIYPGYLNEEKRSELKKNYTDKGIYLKCGCRPSQNLLYGISKDLRIYPLHNDYQHDPFCVRYKSAEEEDRKTAYVIDDDGNVTAYTSFNPFVFSKTDETIHSEQDNIVPEDEQDIEELVLEKDDSIQKQAKKKEPKLSLGGLIRGINVDAFTERVMNGQSIKSKEAFSAAVYYRMKAVRLHRGRKKIGEMTLEKDGCRFMYVPFSNIMRSKENDVEKCYVLNVDKNGKEYKNFSYPDTVRKALKEYKSAYGKLPDKNSMLAGFQYLKKSKAGYNYKVLGRIHFFEVSDTGLYCRSMAEISTFNQLQKVADETKQIRYWIPPEDESIGAIVAVKGYEKKIIVFFKGNKEERVSYDASLYVPMVATENSDITLDALKELLDNDGSSAQKEEVVQGSSEQNMELLVKSEMATGIDAMTGILEEESTETRKTDVTEELKKEFTFDTEE